MNARDIARQAAAMEAVKRARRVARIRNQREGSFPPSEGSMSEGQTQDAASRLTPNGEAGTTLTFKTHLIGCADCTAGELCATGQALFDARLGVPDYLVFAHHGVPYPGDRFAPVSPAEPTPDVTHNAGAGFSEDAIRAEGHDFASWEAGFSAACGVIRARLASRSSVGASEPQDGMALIAAERRRQVEGHGFTAQRDDAYTNGELAMAATHYALIDWDYSCHGDAFWPADWDTRWDQKDEDDRITQLVKAGALIAAEIDRLTRAALSQEARP